MDLPNRFAGLPARVIVARPEALGLSGLEHRVLGEVLKLLKHQPGEISRYEIAQSLKVSLQAAHTGLSGLHKAGLVNIEHAAGEDRYRLTPKLSALKNKLDRAKAAREVRALAELTRRWGGDA